MRKQGLPPPLIRQLRLIADPASDRAQAFILGDRYLKQFLGLFRSYEVRIGSRVLDRALGLMGRYDLASHDACVAAIGFHAGVPDLVSLDKKFAAVDGFELWNDGILARRMR